MNNVLSAIAIDDEPLALQVLEKHAAEVSFLQLQQTFTDVADVINFLSVNKVDLLFADIKMPGISGLQLAETYKKDTQVIFTTAYSEYAVQGFDMAVTDYLLKPISLIRFLQACRKAQQNKAGVAKNEEIFIRNSNDWVKIIPSQVMYAEAKGNYMKVITSADEHLLRMTFSDLKDKFPGLLRVHKSYVVNPAFINRIEQHQLTIGFSKIPVGTAFRSNMMKLLGLNS